MIEIYINNEGPYKCFDSQEAIEFFKYYQKEEEILKECNYDIQRFFRELAKKNERINNEQKHN